MIIDQSCPLWILGPKSDPFGGKYPGIVSVAERAQLICDMPKDVCGYTSFHMLHEVKTRITGYQHLNSPNAMELDDLIKMVGDSGKKILAVTVPAFGFDDLWHGGAILSDDPAVAMRTKDLIKEGLDVCDELFAARIGEGVFIWWPGMDSLFYPFTQEDLVAGRDRLVDFWIEMMHGRESDLYKEFKPKDPGQHDYFRNAAECLGFISRVNAGIGKKKAFANLEFAHPSMINERVDEAANTLLEGNAVNRIVHVNSSGVGLDMDLRVGAINWEETQAAVKLLHNSPIEMVAEHDIKDLHGRPLQNYYESVDALKQMMAA